MQFNQVLNKRNTIECSICLEDIDPHTQGFLDCKHVFCYNCINQWIQINKKCPMCNSNTDKVKLCSNLFPIPKSSEIFNYFGIDKIVHSRVHNRESNIPHYCEALGKFEGGFRYPKYCHYYGNLYKVINCKTGLEENMYMCSEHSRMSQDPIVFLKVVERKWNSLVLEQSKHEILLNTFEKNIDS